MSEHSPLFCFFVAVLIFAVKLTVMFHSYLVFYSTRVSSFIEWYLDGCVLRYIVLATTNENFCNLMNLLCGVRIVLIHSIIKEYTLPIIFLLNTIYTTQ